MYPLTTYCGYRWFYYLVLSFEIPTSFYKAGLLHLLCIGLYQWDFSFHSFPDFSCGLFFYTQRSLFNISYKLDGGAEHVTFTCL